MCSYTEKMRNSSSLFFLLLPQELVTEGLESTLIRNLTDHLGNNLLHCVCSAGHTPLLPLLTSRFGTELTGALSDENRKGLTPVQIAIKVSRQLDPLTISTYINKHVVELGGTISPCGKFFQNLIGGGKFFLHYRGG